LSLSDFLQERKRKLKILVLGAYRPNSILKRLERMQQCLINRKFESTKLVKDFPDKKRYDKDSDIHFTKKSRQLMENWAHLLIFVFFLEGENLGVGNELDYMCLKIPMTIQHSLVLLESGIDIGSQVRGTIKLAQNQKLSFEYFQSDTELCTLALGHCRKVLDRLFYYLD
jgi:hypothetical protein